MAGGGFFQGDLHGYKPAAGMFKIQVAIHGFQTIGIDDLGAILQLMLRRIQQTTW
jgi:hypothetical protein